jgi:hypothetical protein
MLSGASYVNKNGNILGTISYTKRFTWLSFKQCCGSMNFWGGSGSGSADPYFLLMVPDADPAIFVSDLQDVNKSLFFPSFFAYYFLKVHLYHFSKIKSHKEVKKQ